MYINLLFLSLIKRKYFLQGPTILFKGDIVAQRVNKLSSCVSFKLCGNDSLKCQNFRLYTNYNYIIIMILPV